MSGADKLLEANPWGARKDEPAIHVRHADLERASEESCFRSRCPACGKGLLMVARSQVTFRLERADRCTRCAQLVYYTDAVIGGEELEALPS